ncbi:MAG: 2-hydroxyacid dehydrogenase [Candidatus Nealsonbacteria bacterium]|nr:2-hydroxyacid dehydrogenase [Candidatus Nealsonbacteria bacterium]
MKVAIFSTKSYDRDFLLEANRGHGHELVFLEPRLAEQTCRLADEFPAVCAFVNDELDAGVLLTLSGQGTRLIAMRCSGFNNVDLRAADRLGLTVARVPAYSPRAVAEHTLGLILALSRRLHKAYNRVREGNFSLDGLLGFELGGRTAGVIGTGKIGQLVAGLLAGFGCKLLAYDVAANPEVEALGARYVPLDELFAQSDVITLHCPLVPETYHLIDDEALAKMRRGVVLINTSRGKLVDTEAVVRALKSGKIGSLGLDVYEEESDLFYEDLSDQLIQDDVFARMLTFPNVIITGHQAYFTEAAMLAIAEQTIENVTAFEQGQTPPGLITAETAHARPPCGSQS